MKYFFDKYTIKYKLNKEKIVNREESLLAGYKGWSIFKKYNFTEKRGFSLIDSVGGYDASNYKVNEVLYSNKFNDNDITNIYSNKKNIIYINKIVIMEKRDPGWGYPGCLFNEYALTADIVRDELVEKDIVADELEYPINGVYNDGYWYVRKRIASYKYLIKQSNNYYLVNNNIQQLDNPISDQQLVQYYKKYGINDINMILQNLNIKDYPMSIDEKNIYTTDISIDLNNIKSKICLIDEIDGYSYKKIQIDTDNYKIYDKLNNQFKINMKIVE